MTTEEMKGEKKSDSRNKKTCNGRGGCKRKKESGMLILVTIRMI